MFNEAKLDLMDHVTHFLAVHRIVTDELKLC